MKEKMMKFAVAGVMMIKSVMYGMDNNIGLAAISEKIDRFMEADDNFLAGCVGFDYDLDLPNYRRYEVDECYKESKDALERGDLELACHYASEAMKCIGIFVRDEFWRNNDEYSDLRRHKKHGVWHLWDEDRKTVLSDYVSEDILYNLGIMHDEDNSVKIAGTYWVPSHYLSDDELRLVEDYCSYKENGDPVLRERLNGIIKENVLKQQEAWETERPMLLLSWGDAPDASPLKEVMIKSLMDDNYVSMGYPLLRKARLGEKYLL